MRWIKSWLLGLLSLGIVLLVSCQASPPGDMAGTPSPERVPTLTSPIGHSAATPTAAPAASNSPAVPVLAILSEIQQPPVWVKPPNGTEQPAVAKMELHINDTIRTQGEALVEITFSNGLGIRLGNNAVLILRPNNQFSLDSGEMLAWVEPGKHVPTQVVTRSAIAGIRGTTLFIKVPPDPDAEVEFFTWEGTVSVQLPNQPGEALIQTGDQVFVGRVEQNIERIQQRVYQFTPEEFAERREQGSLINKFKQPLPTLKKLQAAIPGQDKPGWAGKLNRRLPVKDQDLLEKLGDRFKPQDKDRAGKGDDRPRLKDKVDPDDKPRVRRDRGPDNGPDDRKDAKDDNRDDDKNGRSRKEPEPTNRGDREPDRDQPRRKQLSVDRDQAVDREIASKRTDGRSGHSSRK